LAFSVAVNVNPDILIIDEALAVGDGHFQKKCIDKIREFQESGRTILFCSHALYLVNSICRRTMWLDHGRVMRWGPTLDVVYAYEAFLLEQDRKHPAEGEPEHERPPTPVRFRDITVCDAAGRPRTAFAGDENALTVFDRRDVSQAFSMSGDRFEIGLISIDHRWAMEPETAAVAR